MKEVFRIPTAIRQFLIERAARITDIERVYLFGSRARGDSRERSDFDLAVEAPGISRATWTRFAIGVEEEIPTLCGVDLVLLTNETASAFRNRIKLEGVILYGRAG